VHWGADGSWVSLVSEAEGEFKIVTAANIAITAVIVEIVFTIDMNINRIFY
jgi:hypothetical protein